MRRLDKLFLSIASLAGLSLSLCMLSLFYDLPYLTYTLRQYQAVYPWIPYVFAGFCAFLLLCFLLLLLAALFSPLRTDDVVLTRGNGTLRFSKQTVESTAKYSFSDVEEVVAAKVRISLGSKPEKLKIYVKLSLNNPERLLEVTEAVQGRIEAALLSSLGLTARAVNIKVVELGTENTGVVRAGDKGGRVL